MRAACCYCCSNRENALPRTGNCIAYVFDFNVNCYLLCTCHVDILCCLLLYVCISSASSVCSLSSAITFWFVFIHLFIYLHRVWSTLRRYSNDLVVLLWFNLSRLVKQRKRNYYQSIVWFQPFCLSKVRTYKVRDQFTLITKRVGTTVAAGRQNETWTCWA